MRTTLEIVLAGRQLIETSTSNLHEFIQKQQELIDRLKADRSVPPLEKQILLAIFSEPLHSAKHELILRN